MRCWNDVGAAAEARKPIRSALGSGRLVQRRGRILIDTPCGEREIRPVGVIHARLYFRSATLREVRAAP